MKKLLLGVYTILLTSYALFSYSLTDPNLVITSWSPYWQFQQWMWQTFFHNSLLLSQIYLGLIGVLFCCYFSLLFFSSRVAKQTNASPSRSTLSLVTLLLPTLAALPLLFSYNALSHDVFNYIFNSRIILLYHANPLVKVAIDFPHDEWIRFMHNTDTTAPYGYGWMAISLLPYLLGAGKFTLTWFMFRVFSVASLIALGGSVIRLMKTVNTKNLFPTKLTATDYVVVLLNPLLLIEVISNSHNDLWMMAPAVLSLAFVIGAKSTKWKTILLSFLLLVFSISIKLSTLVLLPLWLGLIGPTLFELFRIKLQIPLINLLEQFCLHHFAELAAILLFIPLLTARSQQFNPWYLVWLLVWVPFMKWGWLKNAVLVLSISSMLRYLPWLLAGGFTSQIVFEQKCITFLPLIVFLSVTLIYALLTRKNAKFKVK